MMSLKENKAITLIALIITIIVMLILVGVTVAVALNGGLFDTAKKAVGRTQEEKEKEQITAGYADYKMKEISGEVNPQLTVIDATVDTNGDGWDVVFAASGNEYQLDNYGNISGPIVKTEEQIALEKYVLGEIAGEKNLTEIMDTGNMIFLDDESTEENESEAITYLSVEQSTTDANIYVKYKNKAYRIQTDKELNTQKVLLVYTPDAEGKEGKTYAECGGEGSIYEDWIVLYNNGDSLELLSPEKIGEDLKLGYADEEAQNPGDMDGDNVSNTNSDKAIYSYNNAVTRVNAYCASIVQEQIDENISTNNIRSVGNNFNNDNVGNFTSEKIANWNLQYEGNKVQVNGLIKDTDTNYEQDLVRMGFWENTSIGTSYFLASRVIIDEGSRYYFGVRHVDSTGGISDGGYTPLWCAKSNGVVNASFWSFAVRPVVKIDL